jgi:hypothetical protein
MIENYQPTMVACLSLWQPYASWLVGQHLPKQRYSKTEMPIKDIENRTWWTNYRGPLVIHAARRVDVVVFEKYEVSKEMRSKYKCGAFLGVVDLVDCIKDTGFHPAPWNYSPWGMSDQFHWLTKDVVIFNEPISAKGQQRIFRVPLSTFRIDGAPVINEARLCSDLNET